MNKLKWKFKVLICLAGLFIGHSFEGLRSQENPNTIITVKDTISLQDGIPYNEILIAAGESRIRTIRVWESLIIPEQIQIENKRNDSILMIIDNALSIAQEKNFNEESQRFLANEENYWQSANDHLKSQKKRISDLIRSLQNEQQQLASELRRWENTRQIQDSSYAFGNISQVIDTTLSTLNRVTSEVQGRTEMLIQPLNKTIDTEVEVNLLMEKIQQALLEKTSLTYSKTAPAIFEIKPLPYQSGKERMSRDLMTALSSEWNALAFYFNQQKEAFTLYLLFAIGILVLFSWMSTRLKYFEKDNLTYYEATLKVILQRPVTAAILFSLFFSFAFFPDRPPLLIDLIIFLLLIPVVDIGMKLGHNRVRKLIWVFAAMIIIFLGLRFIPSDTLLYRILRLGLGLIELVVLIQLFKHPESLKFPTKTLSRFVRYLVIFHLLLILIGLVSIILGHEGLAQVALDSALTNALVGIILFICAIILIGGLQFLISSKYLDQIQVIHDHEIYLKGFVVRIVILAMTLFWLDATLRIFYIKNTVYDYIKSVFTRDLSVGSMSFSLGDIFLFVFIIWLSVFLSKMVKIILRTDVLDKLSLKKGVPRMITAIAQFTLITVGLLMAVRSIGMPLDQLTIIFSAFSVGIGFGLQNIFNNLVSGVILLFEREVQIGDIIEVGNLTGTVKEMGIRSSHIRTFEGAEVIIPNGLLISKEVIDWTLSDKSRRIEIISGVAYGSNVHQVKKLLFEVIKKHPDVKPDPEPLVLFNAMSESSLDFRLLFWTDQFDNWLRIRSEVILAIHDMLLENDISIPFPQRDLHIKSVDPMIFNQKDQR